MNPQYNNLNNQSNNTINNNQSVPSNTPQPNPQNYQQQVYQQQNYQQQVYQQQNFQQQPSPQGQVPYPNMNYQTNTNNTPKKNTNKIWVLIIIIGLILLIGLTILFNLPGKNNKNAVNTNNEATETSRKKEEQISKQLSIHLTNHVAAVIKFMDNMELEATTEIPVENITYDKNDKYYKAYVPVYNKSTGLLIDYYYVRCKWDDTKKEITNYGDTVKYNKTKSIYESAMDALLFVDTTKWNDYFYDVSDEYDNYVANLFEHIDEVYCVYLEIYEKVPEVKYYNNYVKESKDKAVVLKEKISKNHTKVNLYVTNYVITATDTDDYVKKFSAITSSMSAAEWKSNTEAITAFIKMLESQEQTYKEVI